MYLKLLRQSHNEFGTFGKLIINDIILQTVEQSWNNNKPFVSCIPNGTYNLEFHESPRHGDSYILSNPKLGIGKYKGSSKRYGCLIHKANLASQLQGCVAPGGKLGFYRRQWSVTNSRDTMDLIVKLLGREGKHIIEIKNDFPDFHDPEF